MLKAGGELPQDGRAGVASRTGIGGPSPRVGARQAGPTGRRPPCSQLRSPLQPRHPCRASGDPPAWRSCWAPSASPRCTWPSRAAPRDPGCPTRSPTSEAPTPSRAAHPRSSTVCPTTAGATARSWPRSRSSAWTSPIASSPSRRSTRCCSPWSSPWSGSSWSGRPGRPGVRPRRAPWSPPCSRWPGPTAASPCPSRSSSRWCRPGCSRCTPRPVGGGRRRASWPPPSPCTPRTTVSRSA